MKMKYLLVLLVIGFISNSFTPSGNFQDGYFKKGELISFTHDVNSDDKFYNAYVKRGAFDGTRFYLEIDSNKNYLLSKLRPAMGDKQDELMLVGCNGTAMYDGNNMAIELHNSEKKYFMVDINSGEITKLNNSPKRILLESIDQKGNKAEFYSPEKSFESRVSFSILALPINVKKKELYVANHAPKTIAHFKSIRVEFENEQQIEFPQGCYMLCAGNSFTLK